ncbi:NAD(P)H-dependent oxidoreductase [Vespertiliibacter pulmonis]|uniref:Nitroreductase n=1 Tax=Vespertiliibacter pulmonis TaxID=1443036 RepID=A0A3N4WE49_9PAST|nr:NAD(P)H-dependent oxidoreductase [Vespertiliibacter pulmonis]QLB20872.1 NAD(P)H-dependent oxidoreductase [Vespertiliibacter pulmonis]RPE83524.1 nitroreductase [Vespertiliibacter pulmonis]
MNLISREQMLSVFHRRASTRNYDPNKKIPTDDFAAILEFARLSPSSVGSEPWKFLVIQNSELRQKLKPISWGMATQVDDCSHLVVILAKKNARYDSDFLRESMVRRNLTPEQIPSVIEKYKNFQLNDANIGEDPRQLFDWTSKQTYIALANMLTGAAALGIDSCPIEGFNYQEVNSILANEGLFDPAEWGVSVMATFGYRAKEIKPKARKPIEQVVEWVL